ncbi:helix-turn-helix transcriptional regulator [Sphingomonas aurantiaca]|uniref:helix-turn-helix domain-containing protein n=1 Tax=Sphingomonas aurantiaca TaxID=185949 RepID=UPI002FE2796F
MFDGERLRELMELRGFSQSKLARQVGVSQTTIAKLVLSKGYGSKHLHRIARELGTTPAYLEGETDDPSAGATPPPPAMPPAIMMQVLLPNERALKVMFKALLAGIDRELGEDEQAQLLAQRLPIGLAQLQYARFDLPTPAAEIVGEDLAMSDREPSR